MELYENKELLRQAANDSLRSLKDMKPGTDEYDKAANMALKLYDMQLKDAAQENDQKLREDEGRRKDQEVINDQEKAEKARKLDWAKVVSLGRQKRRLQIPSRNSSKLPPVRSARPMLPWNSTSPLNMHFSCLQ